MQGCRTDPALRARQSLRRAPRSDRRGLGLLDAVLASVVLSLLLLWGGQVIGDRMHALALASEARTVADLARAGRLRIEGDIAHRARVHPVGAAPLAITLADLESRGLRSPAAGRRTPGRRALTLWAWRSSDGAVVVIARARGARAIAVAPAPEAGVSGVGAFLALPGRETGLSGPGVSFDMGDINGVRPGFAVAGDLFALDHVALDVTCRSYLYRVEVDCDSDGTQDAEANRLEVALDMGGRDITGAGEITATTAEIGALDGAVDVSGSVTVGGALEVIGSIVTEDLSVSETFSTQMMDIDGALSVDDLTATGDVSGANLAFDGTLTVSGEARLGAAEVTAEKLTVTRALTVGQLSADSGTFTGTVNAEAVTVTTCTGCAP